MEWMRDGVSGQGVEGVKDGGDVRCRRQGKEGMKDRGDEG